MMHLKHRPALITAMRNHNSGGLIYATILAVCLVVVLGGILPSSALADSEHTYANGTVHQQVHFRIIIPESITLQNLKAPSLSTLDPKPEKQDRNRALTKSGYVYVINHKKHDGLNHAVAIDLDESTQGEFKVFTLCFP